MNGNPILFYVGLFLFFFIEGCSQENASPISAFDRMHSDRKFSARRMISENFVLKNLSTQEIDTFDTKYNRSEKWNLITNSNGDTVFYGFITKLDDLWLLNEPASDSTFHIAALEIRGDTLFGWNTTQFQMLQVDAMVGSGKLDPLVLVSNERGNILTTDEDLLAKFYPEIISTCKDKHLVVGRGKDQEDPNSGVPEEIISASIQLIESSREIQINLSQFGSYFITLTKEGKQIRKSKMNNLMEVKMPTTGLAAGIYDIFITDPKGSLILQTQIELD